ncbi:serine/threonine-protein kinase [Mycobacterium paraense]|uniref:serine/threonine-protein kinase n=1 Tax=Mycobacterium paraense TaxID=767916 RepID=UPI001556B12F|nr:serine/threonine-protein kinase [Mycobacterium paraense]
MEPQEIIDEVPARLGLDNPSVLTAGGQKIVLAGELAGAPAVAKVVLVPDGPSAEIVIKRAHREVDVLGAVTSPNVVSVLTDAVEIGDRPDAICWAEERLSGSDLAALLTSQWTEADVWSLLSDLATGLAACHELEVVHRDLSPGNVRKTDEGRYVLMDPGLARHLAKTALTGQFQPGTTGFMSPEHVPGGRPTPASDIFALGILAYLALTGTLPVDPGVDQATYHDKLRTGSCPDIATARADITAELTGIVNRCLLRQPARRFLDGAELREAVAAARGASS